jgi:hypothetical protein
MGGPVDQAAIAKEEWIGHASLVLRYATECNPLPECICKAIVWLLD